MRINILPGFTGGLLLENNFSDTIKEQHEVTFAANICFKVIDIIDECRIDIFDTSNNIRTVFGKIYDIESC